MRIPDIGWSNWTQMMLVIHIFSLFILNPSIELFISCQHIKAVLSSTTPLQCIRHLINFNYFTLTDLQTISHLRSFRNKLRSVKSNPKPVTLVSPRWLPSSQKQHLVNLPLISHSKVLYVAFLNFIQLLCCIIFLIYLHPHP